VKDGKAILPQRFHGPSINNSLAIGSFTDFKGYHRNIWVS